MAALVGVDCRGFLGERLARGLLWIPAVWTGIGGRASLHSLRAGALERAPWFAIVAVVAVLGIGLRTARSLDYNVPDDAVTSMQYAKNLALGNGLVFNLGERVDGYTNFLWVIVMTPLYACSRLLGVPFVPVVVHVGILLAVTCVGLTYVIARTLWGRHPAVAVALVACVADRAFTTWAVLGLEVHLVAAFMLLALVIARSELPRRGLYLGLALLGAHLTRPDAALFGACLVGSELVAALLDGKRGDTVRCRSGLRSLAIAVVAWLVPYAAYFAWHYAYYGAPFPNTYYAKLGGSVDAWARGLIYLREFFDRRAWVPAFGLVAFIGVGDRTVRTLVAYVTLHLVYVAYVGGDFMGGHRFLVPEVPMMALLVAAAVARLWELSNHAATTRLLRELSLSRDHVAGFGVALVVGGLLLLYARGRERYALDTDADSWRNDHSRQQRLLTWLRDVKPANATFATGLIGHTGFYGEVRVIDTFGIIDPVVARRELKTLGRGHAGHEKAATVDEVLAKKPTYVGIYVLDANLWKRGYYLDTDVPRDTVPGIWVRDVLAERGRVVPGTTLDFERGREGGFVASGAAFEAWPARGNEAGQGVVQGAEGGFLNSFHASLQNRATGTLVSAPFELKGDHLVFRLAGGEDLERLHVALRVDDVVARRATGKNSDVMGRVDWDIRPWRGKAATLELRDDSAEPWGYIAVDAIAQVSNG